MATPMETTPARERGAGAGNEAGLDVIGPGQESQETVDEGVLVVR